MGLRTRLESFLSGRADQSEPTSRTIVCPWSVLSTGKKSPANLFDFSIFCRTRIDAINKKLVQLRVVK
ncbi:hypothetical protein Pla144_03060 [Bythopirellula polymerisocia]|uniref:Uncharacterized protein n=1 Tax=Bythopirellula polymerisocia TaxID=2528003 RepID=A0A5C6CYR0_9BACT|nr:hypothetical protein Pla144_03060 [Bythopirellula polymerisocia]